MEKVVIELVIDILWWILKPYWDRLNDWNENGFILCENVKK